MSKWRPSGTKADKRAFHRIRTGILWHQLNKTKVFRFLTLTGSNNWRRHFDRLRRIIRKQYGKFEYFCIRTDEGRSGVLHILYVGKYLPYEDLRETWRKLADSWTLDIQAVKSFQWIGFELTRQQLPARYSHSRGWLPRGLLKLWRQFCSVNNPKNYNPDGGWIGYTIPDWEDLVAKVHRDGVQSYLNVANG